MTATASAAETTESGDLERRESPYVGLVPYSEADAAFFFGREDDTDIIAANVKTSRLTLLYGASGVGKSSVLLAGVVPRLRELGREKVDDIPSFATAVFRSWRRPPLPGLVEAIRLAVVDAVGHEIDPPDAEASLADALRSWTQDVRTLLVVLDQFEDYFLYHAHEDGEGTFADEFPRVINDVGLRVNFLISLREDAWPKLDRFEGRIPNLFGNYVRVEHLDWDAARSAIVKPIEEYNKRLPAGEPRYEVEPALVNSVLNQVKTGRLALGDALAVEPLRGELANPQIETPFLQLVMERLWRVTVKSGSHELRRQTLDELGGAEKIVRTALAETLHALDRDEQEIAAEVFRYLITPSKTKIAQRTSDLAFWTKRPEAEVEPVLDKLSRARSDRIRILRPIALPAGEQGSMYEIFHDVLAEPILEWRTSYEQEREKVQLAERLKAEQEEREKEARNKRIRIAVIALLVIVAGLIALASVAFVQEQNATNERKLAESREFAADAFIHLGVDPAATVELAAQGLKKHLTAEAESALRAGLAVSHLSAILRHVSGAVHSVAFSHDGKLIVTAGDDGTVRVWTAPNGQPIRVLRSPTKHVAGASFSSDGTRVIAASKEGAAVIWRISTGAASILPGHWSVAAFSPNGRYVVTTWKDGNAGLWAASGRARGLTSLGTPEAPVNGVAFYPVAFSPHSSEVVTTSPDGTARIWRVPSGRLVAVLRGHTQPISTVSFSADGRLVVTASADGTARVVSARTGKTVAVLEGGTAGVNDAAFSPDSRLVATADADRTARIWRVTGGRPLLVIRDPRPVKAVAFSPDGRLLLTGSQDGAAQVWRASDGRTVVSLLGHGSAVLDAAFSPGGKSIATASADGTARVWALPTESSVAVFHPSGNSNPVLADIFEPDGKIVTAGLDGSLRIWSAPGRGQHVLQQPTESVSGATFSSDGTRAAVIGANWDAQLWELPSGRRLARLRSKIPTPSAIAFSPDDQLVAIGGFAGAQIFDANSGRARGILRVPLSVGSLAFSPDNKLLAIGEEQTTEIWDVSRARELRVIDGHSGTVVAAAFSPDGKILATGGSEGTVRLSDTSSWRTVAVLPGHHAVSSVVFSRAGDVVATTSADGTARIWDTSSGRMLTVLRPKESVPQSKEAVLSAAFSADGRRVVTADLDGTARVFSCDLCGPVSFLLELARRIPRPI